MTLLHMYVSVQYKDENGMILISASIYCHRMQISSWNSNYPVKIYIFLK